jgi:membrane protease YdiL (CAAX protease family)
MTVWATAVDLGSLALLAAWLRPEGLRLRDLFRATPSTWRDVPAGLAVLLGLGAVGFAGGAVAGLLCYGTPTPEPPMSPLPTWGALYSTLVWPLLWGVTEEATYNGYAAPRLRARTGSTVATVAVVALGWSLQHTGLPARLDPTFAVFRTLSSLPVAVTATLLYLRTRRLVPLAVAHVLIDAASGALTFRAG